MTTFHSAGPADTVLVVDGTGRGHAVCRMFTATNPAVTVYYGPGCDVIEDERIVPVPSIRLTDVRTALDFLASHPVEFVFVSNIDALSLGYVDELRRAGHRVIGPTGAAAQLEASKARGKRFCVDHGIPVPLHAVFADAEAALEYVRTAPHLCVVKADGLTPDGDGSVVCDSVAEAEAAVTRFAAQFGDALRLVIEERLTGREVSVFALLDRGGALMFPPALDYKRTFDGDLGTNCDGMGSIAPHPEDSPALRETLRATLVEPLVRGVRAEGLDFTGFVYLGAVLTSRGPRVIEINARFGDSEAEVVLPGVRSDFTALCRAVLAGTVSGTDLETDGLARCSVALVQGCPETADPYAGWPFVPAAIGQRVEGLDKIDPAEATALYAGLARDERGDPVTRGGRVLHVVGAGASMAQARLRAYEQVARVSFAGMRYRTDIGSATPPAGPPPSGPAAADGPEPTLAGSRPS